MTHFLICLIFKVNVHAVIYMLNVRAFLHVVDSLGMCLGCKSSAGALVYSIAKTGSVVDSLAIKAGALFGI
jgi:hypothetical protein